MELHITGDPASDQLLTDDAFALLTGMLLDQQVTMESAVAGPEKIRSRIGSIDRRGLQGTAGGPPVPRLDGGAGPGPRGDSPARLER